MTDHSTRMRDQFADMLEATRLTGAGRLVEATDLIQRSLGGGAAPTAAAQGAIEPPTLDLAAERVGEAPRTAEAPRMAEASRRTSGAETVGMPSPIAASPIPEKLREAVGGVVRGLAPVLKGLAGGLARPAMPARPAARGPDGAGAFVTRSFTGPAGTRDYRLFVPSRPQAPAALVVMLHGCNQTADDFAVGTGMNRLAEHDGVFVAYPVQTGRANPQRCWNWFEPRDQGRESGEAAIIAGLTRAVMAEHAIDPARVFIAGLSAGGAAAANVARAYPDLYAAVGVHSGLAAACARDVGSAMMAMQRGAPGAGETRVPTIVFHGEDDATVSVRNADQVLAQAGAGALTPAHESFAGAGHPFTRTRYADAAGRVFLESWRVRGAGHAWSGGDPAGSFTDPHGPDASRAMLDFFAGHLRAA
ncbi:alpha/beta hydrolase family esterase [uncultured Methylobacterium sp.]|uniref:extracellular catalytic domain type 1 short-chain-length polyhydroxyalkanoate depolymerase n=1 Tax=uncultured Methylobacterium sp. TaxID=157278 RepID=UPI0035CC41E8